LFVVSAPSGAGKTSLVNALVQKVDDILISISYTTRQPRPDDHNGLDYHFVSESVFQAMVTDDGFLEHAVVFGHSYGTGLAWVTRKLESGVDVILEIDWQGARQVLSLYADAVSIFVFPPSSDALRDRLIARDQDAPGTIEQRLAESKSEMVHFDEFHYLVVNDNFDDALLDLCHIVQAERLRCQQRKSQLTDLLKELVGFA